MITITEQQDRQFRMETECPFCSELLEGFVTFNPYCRYCANQLPNYSDLIDNQLERILYFQIGEHWEKG